MSQIMTNIALRQLNQQSLLHLLAFNIPNVLVNYQPLRSQHSLSKLVFGFTHVPLPFCTLFYLPFVVYPLPAVPPHHPSVSTCDTYTLFHQIFYYFIWWELLQAAASASPTLVQVTVYSQINYLLPFNVRATWNGFPKSSYICEYLLLIVSKLA